MFFYGFKPGYHREQFHPVVGRKPKALAEFFHVGSEFEDCTVAPGSRISLSGTICVDADHPTRMLVLKILTAIDNRIKPNTRRKTAKPDLPIFSSSHELDRRTM